MNVNRIFTRRRKTTSISHCLKFNFPRKIYRLFQNKAKDVWQERITGDALMKVIERLKRPAGENHTAWMVSNCESTRGAVVRKEFTDRLVNVSLTEIISTWAQSCKLAVRAERAKLQLSSVSFEIDWPQFFSSSAQLFSKSQQSFSIAQLSSDINFLSKFATLLWANRFLAWPETRRLRRVLRQRHGQNSLGQAALRHRQFWRIYKIQGSSKISKIDPHRWFQFYLAFENSMHCNDYVSEKFWRNSLTQFMVPIVYGPHPDDVKVYSVVRNSCRYLL